MNAGLKFTASIVLLAALASDPAHALRCGNYVVNIGDRKHKVLNLCGEPNYVEVYDAPLWTPYYPVQRVEVWTYDFGPTRFLHELRFINGVLFSIDELGYGYRE